jgi:GT2 family glycosyltransferase
MVTVVVCAYAWERRELLRESVRSLHGQTCAPADVIVVVDHNPALLDWVREQVPAVTAIPNVEPAGLAGARNTGAKAARSELVAFIDDDARAGPDWIERIRTAFRDPNVIGAGGAVLAEFECERPRWLPREFDWVVGCTYRGLPSKPTPVRNVIGCNMAFRRDLLCRAGGFSLGLGRVAADRAGCEETELCIRLKLLHPDAVFLYDPGAVVHHRVPPARARLSYFLSRCHAEGVSKALVARRCGRVAALETERAYTRRALPAGIREGLAAFGQGDPAGLARAAAIVLGLAATASGFALTQVSREAS